MKKVHARHHNDIKRLLAKIRAEEAHDSTPDTGSVLDALNAFGYLEAVQQRPPGRLQCFGPKAYKCANGSAVLMWHKPPGIGMHRTLGLLGVWAITQADSVQIITGTRTLAYGKMPFNLESYFYNLRRDFRTYYGNDTNPPDADGRILHTATYTPDSRLALRGQIESVLHQWRAGMQAQR